MAYIGQINIDSNEYPIGSTLYGSCDTAIGTAAKVVTMNGFTVPIDGLTIYIRFNNGNNVNPISLNIGTAGPRSVLGNCNCEANDILSFTYEENASNPSTGVWRTHSCGDMATNSELSSQLSALSPMKFRGVLSGLPTSTTVSWGTVANGDVIIVGNKEYVYGPNLSGVSDWREFGDEEAYVLKDEQTTGVINLQSYSVTDGILSISGFTTNVVVPVISSTP